MAVKFNHAHTLGSHYNKDDVAAFDAETEADLIKRKIADKHTPAKSADKSAA